MFVRRLPIIGIVAFSLCSVNSVANLFLDRAHHPTLALWAPAALVELVTAWLVYQVVETTRKVTKSRISKQDRRFYGGVLLAFLILVIPSLGLSVTANTGEFGSLFLGLQFPLLSVACAIGAALPDVVARREQSGAKEKAEAGRRKAERDRERAEAGRRKAEKEQREAEIQQTLDSLGATARQILGRLMAEPTQSQADVAQALGVKRQSVAHHFRRLESLGLVERNGGGVEILVDLPADFGENGKE
jgi:hypothetical protein